MFAGIFAEKKNGSVLFACNMFENTASHKQMTLFVFNNRAMNMVYSLCKHHSVSAHGHNYFGERHIPVLLKDVAGLVPGAWEGKGRGNRYCCLTYWTLI